MTNSKDIKRVIPVKHVRVDEILEEWVQQAIQNDMIITGDFIRGKWKYFARLLGVPSSNWLHLSNGWLDCFKNCNSLKNHKRHGEIGSTNVAYVQSEIERLGPLLRQFEL
ncbi:hypothetical protein O181_113879 [Austropuccinia psidii MF-1]|uniref:HTH CENPB-type domain-containing protein n=1 Tax=Austropuccinia psidii MF-1 TaxID=1389203 RepID=A0A9Q3K6R5_9BASI|nr:hypothetical protein [Austropuccinia psidii MF-1]